MKAERGGEGCTPRSLNLGTNVVDGHLDPRYATYRMSGWLQGRFRCGGQEKHRCLCRKSDAVAPPVSIRVSLVAGE
jgi:hypothetical protein